MASVSNIKTSTHSRNNVGASGQTAVKAWGIFKEVTGKHIGYYFFCKNKSFKECLKLNLCLL